jgi:primosomal protein N' (replication factor Y)
MTAASKPIQTLQVALPVPLIGLFDYLPLEGQYPNEQWIGCRVEVPFGTRSMVGWVNGIGFQQDPNITIKPIHSRIDSNRIISDEWLSTIRWIAQYYQAPLGEVFSTAVPTYVREGRALPDTQHYAWQLTDKGRAGYSGLRSNSQVRLLSESLVQVERSEAWLELNHPKWRKAVKRLLELHFIERMALSKSLIENTALLPGPALNNEQQICVNAINHSNDFAVHLLDGITGSGKTEVYIQAILHCLARGKQALILVPEIGLTPQTLDRFNSRLPVAVNILHSNLSDGARMQAWAAMAEGSGRVLIGTRSAVFASLPEAGLIIVDEEHDASYKQQDGFHYHARDVAAMRAKALNIPIILGSATPSLESLNNVETGRYQLHRLSQRAGPALPPIVKLVDIRKRKLIHGLGQELLDGIRQCLDKGEQALVFKNRRGYAPALLCHDCGFTAMCPRCDRTLTLHAGQKRLMCHHCGHQKPKPLACPDCGSLALQAQGYGTERLEEALANYFPETPCIRVDSETTRKRNGLELQLQLLGSNAGILIGTQILAKGHDLPLLSFVGVVGVDEGLFSADFRAPEKLAQLLIQVSGRSGRSTRAGTVLIQTHHPENPILLQLLHGGYHQFAQSALIERKCAELPPYTFMALMRCESVHQESSQQFLADVTEILKSTIHHKKLKVHSSGAMPAPMPKRAGKSRWQLALTAKSRQALQQLLALTQLEIYQLKSARKVRWSIDIDPMDFS